MPPPMLGRELGSLREDAMSRLILGGAAVLAASAAYAQAPADLPARTELHPIPTLWITDQQFSPTTATASR